MYRNFKLGNKTLLVKPYTTELELDVLETLKFNDFEEEDLEPLVDYFLEKTVKKVPNLSKLEKILTIWFIRMITIGDEISIVFKCKNCGKTQNKVINLSDFINIPTLYSEDVKPKILSENEFALLNKDDELDEDMDIETYQNINLFDYYFIYKEKIMFNCGYCNFESFTNLITYKSCLSFLSEESFESLTSWLHILVYSDNLTRSDILNMTPIERMIEISYFKEQTKENENAE